MVEEPRGGGSGAGWPGTCRRAGPPGAHVAEAVSAGWEHGGVRFVAHEGDETAFARSAHGSGAPVSDRHRPRSGRNSRLPSAGWRPRQRDGAATTARAYVASSSSFRVSATGPEFRGLRPRCRSETPTGRTGQRSAAARLHVAEAVSAGGAHVAEAASAGGSHVAVAGPPGVHVAGAGSAGGSHVAVAGPRGVTCRWSAVGWPGTCRSSRSCGKHMSLRRCRRTGHMSQ